MALDNSCEIKFRSKLNQMCSDSRKTILLGKDAYYELINELKTAIATEKKNRRQYYILSRQCVEKSKLCN